MTVPATVTDFFIISRQEWLHDARTAAQILLKNQNTVTIEDVLKICPLPTYLHSNTIGRVFGTSMFIPVGFTASKRPAMNGRTIRRWTLARGYEQIEDITNA